MRIKEKLDNTSTAFNQVVTDFLGERYPTAARLPIDSVELGSAVRWILPFLKVEQSLKPAACDRIAGHAGIKPLSLRLVTTIFQDFLSVFLLTKVSVKKLASPPDKSPCWLCSESNSLTDVAYDKPTSHSHIPIVTTSVGPAYARGVGTDTLWSVCKIYGRRAKDVS